jgi:hypothetical protein
MSYLLRLWRENGADRPHWRASLEKPYTSERQGFTSLTELFAFLEQETGSGQLQPMPKDQGDSRASESGE